MTATASRRGLSTAAVVNIVTAVAVVLFWLVSTSWQPWNLLARAGFSADFYDEQARVFLRGRLAVDPLVPGPEGFLIDGKTYLYYGPFLSVVRVPFQLFGDLFTSRLVRLSMLVAVVVLCRWSARLARAANRTVTAEPRSFRPRPQTHEVADERWVVGLFTAAVAFSPAIFAAGWISVYNETELWAFTLALISATLILEWAATQFTATKTLLGAIAAALGATLTRAPIGLGVAFAIGVCGLVLACRNRAERRSAGMRVAGIAIAGGLVPLLAHAAVNFAKFGTLFSVPGGRQLLSLQDPWRADWFAGNNDSFFSPQFLTTTLVQYLRPDAIRFERLVPGIRFGPVAANRADYPLLGNTPSSSLTLTATLLLILAVVGAIWIVRRRALTWGLVVVCTAGGALPTFLIGFLAQRYLIDMLPPLTVAGAVGAWVIGGWAAGRSWARWIAVGGLVLVVWGAWANLSLATWTLDQKSAWFTELRYRVDDALFPAPSPGLVEVQPGDPVGRDGLTAIHVDPDLGCTGVYTAEQGVWVAIERGGARQVTQTITADRIPTPLAGADTWTVDLDLSDPAAAQVIVTDGAGTVVSDQPVPGWTPLGDGEEREVTVIVDPVTGTSTITVELRDGRNIMLFLPGDLLTAGSLRPPAAESTPSPLCEQLNARL